MRKRQVGSTWNGNKELDLPRKVGRRLGEAAARLEAGDGQGGRNVLQGRAVAGDEVREGCQGQIMVASYAVLRNLGLDLVFRM